MSRKSTSGLRESTGFLLNLLASSMRTDLERRLKPLGVTRSQWLALASLFWKDASNAGELSRFLGIDATATSRLLDRLEGKGLLRRVRLSSDRRTLRLELTDAARDLIPRLAETAEQSNREFLGPLETMEVHQLKQTMRRLLSDRRAEPPRLPGERTQPSRHGGEV